MRHIGYLFSLLLFSILVSACKVDPTPIPEETVTKIPAPVETATKIHTPVEPVTETPEEENGYPWWNESVFYEIFVRSYYDSDGDGIGDLNGLVEKLDYLNDGDPETDVDLGVTGIWLMPINPSPSYHGYDVSDYYAVNPEYGTMEDFQLLLEGAHQRGIRVIVDLVLNHSSIEHPTFKASKDAGAPERDWYVWSEDDPGFRGPWGQQVWHEDPSGYYYGIFWEGMPDLNYRNTDVQEEMLDVARFWVEDVGVDGFRLDAARHIIEDGSVQEDTEETHAWWRTFRDFIKGVDPQALTMGEVWTVSYGVASYVKGDQLDAAFDFDLAGAIIRSVNARDARGFNGTIKTSVRLFTQNQNAPFLTNHDMDRVMNQLGEDIDKAKSAATLLMTVPGIPFMYYGEEIGMLGVKPDEKIRTPMQWNDERSAGFTTGSPWQPINPDYEAVNVASQVDDPNSLLAHYRNLINLRNRHAALRIGQYLPLEVNSTSIATFVRAYENEVVIVIVNLDDEPASELSLTLEEGSLMGEYEAVVLYGDEGVSMGTVLPSPLINERGGFDDYQPLADGGELAPNGKLIIQLQPK
jgi:alpha-amylase